MKRKNKFEKNIKKKKNNFRLTCVMGPSAAAATPVWRRAKQTTVWVIQCRRTGAVPREAVDGHDRSSRRWRRKGRWDRQWSDAPRSFGPSRRPSGRATCPPRITTTTTTTTTMARLWWGVRGARAHRTPPRPAFDFAATAAATRHVKCYHHSAARLPESGRPTPPDTRNLRSYATIVQQCTASAPRLPPKT